jgi:hypothetical protein
MDGRLNACRCCGYNSVETNLLNNSTIRIHIYAFIQFMFIDPLVRGREPFVYCVALCCVVLRLCLLLGWRPLVVDDVLVMDKYFERELSETAR